MNLSLFDSQPDDERALAITEYVAAATAAREEIAALRTSWMELSGTPQGVRLAAITEKCRVLACLADAVEADTASRSR